MTLVILAHHVLVRLRQRLMGRDPTAACTFDPSRLEELPEAAEGERGAHTAGSG